MRFGGAPKDVFNLVANCGGGLLLRKQQVRAGEENQCERSFAGHNVAQIFNL